MRVLFLGPDRPKLIAFMAALGDEVVRTEEPLDIRSEIVKKSDFLVSYGYRRILNKDTLRHFDGRAINLHISYLPYNRGADPNLWSFLEDTPKGVTIHKMVPEIDAGDILVQQEVLMDEDDTLRSSYQKLTDAVESLFMESWPRIRIGKQPAQTQPAGGTSHKLRDKSSVSHLLTQGWDTPVRLLTGKGLIVSRS